MTERIRARIESAITARIREEIKAGVEAKHEKARTGNRNQN